MIHPICWQKAGGAWTVRLLLMKGTAWASRTLAKESKNCTWADDCVIHVLMRVAWKGYVKQLDSYGSYDCWCHGKSSIHQRAYLLCYFLIMPMLFATPLRDSPLEMPLGTYATLYSRSFKCSSGSSQVVCDHHILLGYILCSCSTFEAFQIPLFYSDICCNFALFLLFTSRQLLHA
jgi:hypothetical protein